MATTQLPVFQTVFDTYGMLAKNWVKGITVLIGPIVLLIAIAILGFLMVGATMMSATSTDITAAASGGHILSMLIFLVLLLFPYTMIYVGLFRLGINGDTSGSGFLGVTWGKRETRVLLRSILLGIILIVLAIPVMIVVSLIVGGIFIGIGTGQAPSVFSILISGVLMFILGWVPLAFVGMRLSLYPASPAVDEDISLGGSWSQTSGNGLRLVAISILVALPIYVINLAIGLILGSGLIASILSLVLMIVSIMLTPFLMSIIYKALANRAAAAA